jgi:2-C-methyl-D-erythritol 4-phosphate cytidylyltransferase
VGLASNGGVVAIALVVAAGSGQRLGAERPKALVEVAGRPLLQWSLDVLGAMREIDRIVVALPPYDPVLPAAIDAQAGTLAVAGGAVRSESVALALAAAGPGDPVVIHDAARPLLTADLVQRTIAAVGGAGVDGAVAAAAVTDTIKRADTAGRVQETLERSTLWAVQTPQVFRREALERALAVPQDVLAQATDDAWLVERSGGCVVVVAASRENLKVTTPLDLGAAEALLLRRGPA